MCYCRAVVVLVCYVAVGMLICKVAKKAEGEQICPNVGFWKDLPFLVKVL